MPCAAVGHVVRFLSRNLFSNKSLPFLHEYNNDLIQNMLILLEIVGSKSGA